MWFVSKKKYNAMIAERNKWDSIAAESIRLCQEFREQAARWEEVARSCQVDNRHLITSNKEMLTRVRDLENEKDALELQVEILNTDYDALDYEHVALCRKAEELREELNRYKERCRYLEDELLYYQE